MDVFSHALWSAAAGQGYNLKKNKPKRPIKTWLAAVFGVFPDVFAFTPAFIYMFASYIWPTIPKMAHPSPGGEVPLSGNALILANLTHDLYAVSHSLFTFFLVFGLIWLIRRRPMWELLGWLGHILIDIPTHSLAFYPTPFLWPFSDFKVNGYHWANLDFLVVNYSLLVIAYILIFWLGKRKNMA